MLELQIGQDVVEELAMGLREEPVGPPGRGLALRRLAHGAAPYPGALVVFETDGPFPLAQPFERQHRAWHGLAVADAALSADLDQKDFDVRA
jgi:hypothetical protein